METRSTKVVTVCNQKGGAGKSTITMQLAGTFGIRKKKILIIDADVQNTAIRWASNAEEDKPFPARVAGLAGAGSKVHVEVKKFIGEYDIIFIDCPPAVDSVVPQSALVISDLALVPMIPSPPDLWASVGIRELIERTESINETMKSRIVVNMLQQNTNVSRDIMEILQDFKIPVCETMLHLRTAYRQSSVFGSTVHSMNYANKAIKEVESLADEVEKIINC